MAKEAADTASEITVIVKWSGKDYEINNVGVTSTVSDFKEMVYTATGVKPERQKLLGLKCKAKAAADSNLIKDTNAMKAGTKIMMMGTKEADIETAIKPPEDMPEVVDDFDVDDDTEIPVAARDVHLAKIERRVQTYKIEELSPPREGKHLLVLDIDYTLFAATSMKWIKAKMKELGVEGNPNYKVAFYVDSLAMITVDAPKYGVVQVKPLGVIWGKYPQWSAKNTIMFDDIRRNFLMNPQSGLKIRPFKKAHFSRGTDRELLYLTQYLQDIAELDDFTSLDHRKWEAYKPGKKPKMQD